MEIKQFIDLEKKELQLATLRIVKMFLGVIYNSKTPPETKIKYRKALKEFSDKAPEDIKALLQKIKKNMV